MAVEIEAKMKVNDLQEVAGRLASLGAAEAGSFLELNVFFDTDDRSLLAADKGLRLRTSRNVATGEESHIITYKGPRQHAALKQREEFEVVVAAGRDAERLLTALGYQKVMAFEKRRTKYKYEGCSVELDELPYLGAYVEVEGPNEAVIQKVREALGLSKAALVRTSYVAMLMNHLQESGRHERLVTFENAGGSDQ